MLHLVTFSGKADKCLTMFHHILFGHEDLKPGLFGVSDCRYCWS